MDFDLATWNVRTMNRAGALRSLLLELERYKVKIAALQETRWNNKDISDVRTHTILSSGSTTGTRQFGVAFVVDKSLKPQILDFQPISERLCTLRIKTKFRNISIINAHAPTEEKSEEEKDEFYQNLMRIFDHIPSNDIKMMLGDFNAKIGKELQYMGTIGKHSLHATTNDNGGRLIDLASSKGMVVSSTFFPHKNIHKMTWTSPDGRTSNQIDHVLIEKRSATSILDVRSYRGACCGSDHHMVKARFRARLSVQRLQRTPREQKLNIDKLKAPETEQRYRELTHTRMLSERMSNDVDGMWTSIKRVLKVAAEQTVGVGARRVRSDWFDVDCRRAIAERNSSLREYLSRPTRAKLEAYRIKRRTADKLCRKKKREISNRQIQDIYDNFQNNNIRQAYREVKAISSDFKPRTTLCKDNNGGIIAEPAVIQARWKEHFERLLNANTDTTYTNERVDIPDDGINMEPPTLEELKDIIKSLKNNKAPGIDGIPAELVKKGGIVVVEKLHELITKIWMEEYLPNDWKEAIICPIHKKGDKLRCENYRGISLLSIGYKIFTTSIKNKLEPISERLLGEYQAGFRRERSTTDQLFTLKQLLEKCWERNVNIYQIFVDFKQAYDSIQRKKLLQILLELGVPAKLVRLIQLTHLDTNARVRVQNTLTDAFQVNQGLKQGDGLAPMLFNLALEAVIRKTSIQRNYTLVNKSAQVIGYADDINIVGRSVRAVKECYSEIKEAAKEVGLRINEEKTKVMLQARVNRPTLGNNLTIDEHKLEVVDHFAYLGSTVTNKNEELEEISRRILLGNKTFFAQRKLLKSRAIHRKTKFTLYKTLIRPVICYGSETWTLTQRIEDMLNSFERKILRSIIGPICQEGTWRIRYNNELYQIYDDIDLVTFVKLHRLRWAGHVERMPEERVAKKVFTGIIEGERPVGRPRKRWADAVAADAETLLHISNWRTSARNRDDWRKRLEEAKARVGL